MAFFLRFFTILATFTVSWFNTTVDVPLDANLDDYMDTPTAELLINGVVRDTDVYYQMNGVNYTFQSTINTGVVKTYTLYYEAYFEEFNIRDEQAITFNVYDDIPPEIRRIPSFIREAGDDPPDFSVGFIYIDNYDDVDELTMTIDESAVHYDVIGTYTIYYKVTDTSFNETVTNSTINIIDSTSPVIEQKEQIIIECGETVSLYDFFDIEDAYDVSPRITINQDNADLMTVGEYNIIITAKDQSDNTTQLETTVYVVDTTPPDIRLMSNPNPITVFDEDALSSLSDYVIDVTDQGVSIPVDQLTIIHDIQIDRIGTYHIDYSITDAYGNEQTVSLAVKVIDDIAPTITLLQDLTFPVFSAEQFLNTYFLIDDNYDDPATLDIEFDANPTYDVVGDYQLTVIVEDSSDNIAKYETFIHIVDVISPTITQLNDIVITDFQPHILNSYFSCEDNYDDAESLVITINDDLVDYELLGIYNIQVSVMDESLNETIFDTELFVVDVVLPTLELLQNSLTIAVNDAMNLRSIIKTAYDNYEALTIEDVIIIETVDLSVVGVYDVIYTLTDESGNQALQTLTLIVDDFEAPTLSVTNLSVNQYDTVDLYEGITYHDNVSNVAIICYPQTIDTSLPGEQIITYIAQDERGNYTQAQRIITILEVSNTYDIEDFIPTIVIVCVGVIIIVVIKKRA